MDVGVDKLAMAAIGGVLCIVIGGWLCLRGVAGSNVGSIEMPGVKISWQLTGPGLGLVAIGAALMYAAIERPMTTRVQTETTAYPASGVSGAPTTETTTTEIIERFTRPPPREPMPERRH